MSLFYILGIGILEKSLHTVLPRNVLVNEEVVQLKIHFLLEIVSVCESLGEAIDFVLKVGSFMVNIGDLWPFHEITLKGIEPALIYRFI